MFSVHIIIIYRYVFRKYYTDPYDVDEDMMTIVNHGGRWIVGSNAGTACRNLFNSPSTSTDNVVSKKNNIQPPSKIGGYVMYCNFTMLIIL